MQNIQVKSLIRVLVILLGVAIGELRMTGQTTIPFPLLGTTWKHCSNSLDGVDWTNPSYDDSGPPWFEGPALLSNDTGNGTIAPMIQTLMVGPRISVDGGPAQHSYYFRKKFTVAGPLMPSVLRFAARIDDGAIFFLNGNPIYYLRMTNGTPLIYASSDFATGYACGGDADCGDDVFEAPATGLVEGENVLAVMLFQEGTDSSDMTFGVAITEMVPAVAPMFDDPAQPADRIVPQNHMVVLTASATGLPAPTYQWYKDGTPIDGATEAAFTIPTMQESDAGMYFCRATNLAGFADTRTANIQFTTDTEGPKLVRAVGSGDSLTITVECDEFLDPASAEDVFNYTVTDGATTLVIDSAVLAPNGSSISLTINTPYAPDTLFMVIAGEGLTDLAGNPVVAGMGDTAQFRSWAPTRCGGVIFEAYNGTSGPTVAGTMAGNAVSVLTAHPSFPNSPSESTNLNAFDSRVVYADDSHEGYGGRLRGLFIPPASGLWRLYLRSDDASELWFNRNGPSSSGRALVAQETGCCNAFLPPPAQQTSQPLNLTAGQAYYIEALYKEGTGGDFCQVAAKLEADPTAPGTLTPIPGGQLGSPAAPPGIVGAVVIAQQPADQSVTENMLATFSVLATNANGAPICYQWQRDGVDIPTATGASYSLSPALTDSGAKFSVIVSVLGAEATSTEATLTVSVDTQGPVLVGAFSSLDGTNVTLKFNERLEPSSAQDSFGYSIAGFVIDTAVLQANQTDVLLGISPAMAIGSTHMLSIQGVTDLAGNAMVATQALVQAHVITYGCARYDLFLGLSSATVVLSDLTGAPAYPHSPSLTRFKNIMELNTADEFEGYGTRLTGFLIPPVGGDYTFYFHSDDNGQFSLSSDDSPDNLTVLCNEPVWSNRRTWVGEAGGGGRVGVPSASGGPQANISGPINLAAGQMYYFEALMKEGGGGDNMGVNWKPPGGAEPVNDTPSAIPPEALASLADPVSQAANIKGPRVSLSISGDQITLSWSLPGYKLQSKSELGTPGGWVDVPNGGTSPVTLTIGAGNQFYRLSQ